MRPAGKSRFRPIATHSLRRKCRRTSPSPKGRRGGRSPCCGPWRRGGLATPQTAALCCRGRPSPRNRHA
eukprot:6243130-Lingulodinium_polyedra.AAC.1